MEYLKNVVFKLFVMEDGLEKLLPVVATFLQFSPEELERIRQVRSATRHAGMSFFSRLSSHPHGSNGCKAVVEG